MKKKGFTLIELLAVIVVLAIIALIATPMVLNTIEKAREGAAKASAETYMRAIEEYMVKSQLDTTKPQLQAGVKYQLSSKKYEVASIANPNEVFVNDLIDIKGDKPESGYVIVTTSGTVDKMEMVIKDYPVTCSNDSCEVTEEKKENESEVTEADYEAAANALIADLSSYLATDADASTYTKVAGESSSGSKEVGNIFYNLDVYAYVDDVSTLAPITILHYADMKVILSEFSFTVENGIIKDGTITFGFPEQVTINVVNGEIYKVTEADYEVAANALIADLSSYLTTDENASTYTKVAGESSSGSKEVGNIFYNLDVYAYVDDVSTLAPITILHYEADMKVSLSEFSFTVENGIIKDGTITFSFPEQVTINVVDGAISK